MWPDVAVTARKPTHLKVLEGNPGKRRINRSQPHAKVGPPEAPSWLGKVARTEWDRVIQAMPPGHITLVDRAVLAVYCDEWQTFEIASRDVARRGVLTPSIGKGPRGLVKNPALVVKHQAAQHIRLLAAELGFTPASRSGMTLPQEAESEEVGMIMQPERRRGPTKAR